MDMESINVSELVERLGSDEDPIRKMAVFKLQSNVGDPSFADVFILEGGLSKLRHLVLTSTGNTLAYSLTSFARLLEVDKGWEAINPELIEKVVELVVLHPLVNILRGAMSMLVYIVSHPHNAPQRNSEPDRFGFRALKPAIAIYPQFLEMLVSRLSSADHALCANALLLINSLMREAITNDSETEWPKFIKRLQDLGVIDAVYGLMQGNALQDLSQPLFEFQALTKVLLRKWRELPVDLDKPDHRRALKSIHAASNPEKVAAPLENGEEEPKRKQHNPEKWRRLGFESEAPAFDFVEVGYLGMMDVTDYVRKQEDAFQRFLLEQSKKPKESRCPFARTSLSITAILLEHFEVDKAGVDEAKSQLDFESKHNTDKIFKPLVLQWSLLHTAGMQAFFRLWSATSSELADFPKIYDLVRILLEAVVGSASRTQDIKEVQRKIVDYDVAKLRQLQMELLELTYEDNWGHHLRQIKDELSHEALSFVKEQRIRCLLAGAWFPNAPLPTLATNGTHPPASAIPPTNPFRYAKLSPNRRYLHYNDFPTKDPSEPPVDLLSSRLDLSLVTSVTSNVSAAPGLSLKSSTETLKRHSNNQTPSLTTTKITISGHAHHPQHHQHHTRNQSSNPNNAAGAGSTTNSTTHSRTTSKHAKESPLLILNPQTQTLASEWLDGLLMLLNQQPITHETTKLVNMIRDYGLKIRLLNVRFDEMEVLGKGEGPVMPDREGVDEDFWYEDFGN